MGRTKGVQVIPAKSDFGYSKFPENLKSYGNHTPVSHALIYLLNSKFALFERTLSTW